MNNEALGSLKTLIADGLVNQRKNSAKLAENLVDALESTIRLAWYLADSRAFLVNPSEWTRWVEGNFQLSISWVRRLKRLAPYFARDIHDIGQRKTLGIEVPGLEGVAGIHLREQIIQTGVGSLNQLLSLTGIRDGRYALSDKNDLRPSSGRDPVSQSGREKAKLDQSCGREKANGQHDEPHPTLSAIAEPVSSLKKTTNEGTSSLSQNPTARQGAFPESLGLEPMGDPFSVALRIIGLLQHNLAVLSPDALSPLQRKVLSTKLVWPTELYQTLRDMEERSF